MPAQVVPPFDDTSIFDPSAGVFQNTEAKSDPATVEHPFSDAPHVYTALDTVVGKPLRLPADEHKDDEHSLPAECSNIPHVDGPPGPADAEHPVFTPNDTPYRVEEVNDATDGSRPDRDDDIDEATSVDVGEVEIQPVESYAVEEAETGECLFQEPEGNDNVSSMTTDLPNAPPAIVPDVFELAVDDVDLTFMEPTIASEGQRGYNDVVSPELEQHSTCVTTALADDTAEHILSDNAPTLKEFDEAKSLDEPLVADTTITNALYNEPSLFVDGNNSTTAEPQSNPQDEAAASPEFIPSSTCEQTQLSDIVPAPVSADPSVPDPASVGQSPQTPDISLPTSPSSTRAYAGPHFAIPASVVKALDLGLSGHSNGLFTPVNGLVDGTPAPSEGGSEPIAGTTTPIPIVNMPLDEGVETVSAMGEASIPDNRIGTAVAWADDQKQSPVAQDTDDLTSTAVDDEIVLSSTVSLDGHPNLAEKSDVAESQQFQLPIHDEHPYTVPPPALVDLAADGLYDDLSLSYPESGEESPQHPPSAMEGDREMDQGSDEDADGEIDPDYVPTSERETQSTEVDPFTLMGNDSTVAPGAVENDEPSSSESTSNSDTGESFILKPVQSDLQSHVPSENGRARSPQQPTDSAPAHPEAAHAFQDSIPDTSSSNPVAAAAMMEPPSVEAPLLSPIDEAADATAPPKQLKRKRPSPAGSSSRLTRSKSKGEHASESSQSGSSRRRNGRAATQMKLENGKLEGNSPEEPSDDEPSQSSASSVARRLLAPTSRTGSVASTASTDSAPATQVENRHSPDAQPPLIHTHTHAFIHHHHGRPPAPAPPPPARKASRSKTPALSRAASVDTQGSATTSTNSQRPSPVKRLPSMNSPVTRSNCRFHKISLPREEGGPRLSFIVPGCSLGDGELMNDEEIVDHGFATIEDHGRMIPDIESLEFNPYMVGVLRQLVGVDLLREQEVFYLPNPGEELPKKRRKKKKSRKSVVEKVKAFHRQSASQDVRAPGSSRVSELSRRSNTPSSSSASRSVGDSASVAGSSYKMEDSITGSDEDASDVDEPRTKRRKLSPVSHGEAPSPAPVSVGGELAQEPSNKPSQLRRSRRKALNPDAAAYKPTKDESADEDADDDIGPSSRKGKARKSTKRSRTVEDDAGDVPKPKKSRLRKSISVSVTARSVNAD
ncbi:hypothetical protein OF83DRAFT_177794 [Amylostereum chailletii]|nr:hypothetical protein OF83DRAFT_177794 [Amylostereum chailletii]